MLIVMAHRAMRAGRDVHGVIMPVTLEIDDVPEELIARLARRAIANRRSLDEELVAILHAATSTSVDEAAEPHGQGG